MPRLSELPKGESTNILLYGLAGSAKTVFCGTAGSRTLYFDCGNSVTTLQSKWFQSKYGPSDPDVHKVSEIDLPDKAQALDYIVDTIEMYLDKKSDEFDTVVVDDMSAFRKFAMNQGLELNGELNRSLTRKNLKAKEIELVIAAKQDFGAEMAIVQYFLSKFTDLLRTKNKSFIVTAHEKIWQQQPKNAEGKVTDGPPSIYRITPAFTGQKYPDSETGVFDIVMHMETAGSGENTVYRARMNGDEQIVAKHRYGDLFPTLYPNPRFGDIITAIRTDRKIGKDGKFVDGKP